MIDLEQAPIRIRGNPTPEEIAAVFAVLLPLLSTTAVLPPQAASWHRPRWELDVADRQTYAGRSGQHPTG